MRKFIKLLLNLCIADRKRKCCNSTRPKVDENRMTEEKSVLACPRVNQNHNRNQATLRRSENIYQVINEDELRVAEGMVENSLYDGGSFIQLDLFTEKQWTCQ